MSRQIVLDTETTGLEVTQGHRIIEIGAVELVNRKPTGRHYHQYIHPEREIDEGALQVHGITLESLQDKPKFSEVADEFLEFVDGAEIIIHNAPFDIGFLDAELELLQRKLGSMRDRCAVLDSLVMARKIHPGQRNNLDALCKRYEIDNSQRELHGALLDAEILAEVYLAMTGGQVGLGLEHESEQQGNGEAGEGGIRRLPEARPAVPVVAASEEELNLHRTQLLKIKQSSDKLVWQSDL